MLRFREYNQKQSFFRQFIPEELLEEHHPARIVDLVVERLDLGSLYQVYVEEGNVAYHPKMMLKVLFYSYLIGLMSCRKMEDGLQHRADFMYLSADQVPDFRTLNNFRLRHMEQLPGLFAQIVLLCATLGMIDFKHLAIDGEKIAACSNFRNNVDRERAKKQLERVKKGMARLLAQEPDGYVSEEQIEKRIETLKRREEKLERALKELDKLEDSNGSVNLTDADAKIMSHKDRRILPSYNHQSAVDGKYGISCAVSTVQRDDAPEDLFRLVDEASTQAGGQFEAVLADCAFCEYENLVEMEEARSETFYVPDRRIDTDERKKGENGKPFGKARFTRQDNGQVVCPAGQMMEQEYVKQFEDGHTLTYFRGIGCSKCEYHDACTKYKHRRVSYDSRDSYRQLMRERLKSRHGAVTYQKRQGIIEPVHGHEQKNLGWRQHWMRGLKKAKAEFLLIRIGTNIAKIARNKADELYHHCLKQSKGTEIPGIYANT
jgi:transposase